MKAELALTNEGRAATLFTDGEVAVLRSLCKTAVRNDNRRIKEMPSMGMSKTRRHFLLNALGKLNEVGSDLDGDAL